MKKTNIKISKLLNAVVLIMEFSIIALLLTILLSCNSSNETKLSENIKSSNINKTEKIDKGIGPINNVVLNHHVDKQMSASGRNIFEAKCSACHKMGKRFIGPSLDSVTTRRSPEWIMNMILNPEQMVKENDTAKKLLMEYISPMANQSLTEDEARSILEYFIENDNNS